MLSITVRFLHGTLRAGSPDDTVMAGGEPVGEWPPSPARLFSAFVAADGTGERCSVTAGDELAVLEQLGSPKVFADEWEQLCSSALRARYVVRDSTDSNMVHNYPARTSREVRPGVKLSPNHPEVVYVWDHDVDDEVFGALARRAARIGYLGCSDSPVQVVVGRHGPPDYLTEWRPGATGGLPLPVPYPGFLDALDDAFARWSGGEAMRRSWIPTRRAVYGTEPTQSTASPSVIWLTLDRAIHGRKALLVSETLRAAVLDHVDRLLRSPEQPGGSGAAPVPWQLHGHSIPDDVRPPYQIARFLPLANVGYRHSDGRIRGAAVWLPPACPPELVQAVRTALLARIRRLVAPGLDVGVDPTRATASLLWSANPRRWIGPARRWFSATPVVVERGRRRGPTLEDVRSWFSHAGHPEPVWARISPVPTKPGVVRLGGREVHRRGKDRHPFYWLDVVFEQPVEGPLCVGRSRSFGMGLFAPEMRKGQS
ncbi:MAG: type I-U CRISPR-associated protein Csb2 [Acidimicrobiales bacterium]|nr:type I-U CRISPR-associated protein Csb2 [Acidimicrobiales bacterium]